MRSPGRRVTAMACCTMRPASPFMPPGRRASRGAKPAWHAKCSRRLPSDGHPQVPPCLDGLCERNAVQRIFEAEWTRANRTTTITSQQIPCGDHRPKCRFPRSTHRLQARHHSGRFADRLYLDLLRLRDLAAQADVGHVEQNRRRCVHAAGVPAGNVRFASQRLCEILNLALERAKTTSRWIGFLPWPPAIAERPEHHGKTYHLTPHKPVSMRLTRDVIEEAFEKYTEWAEERTHGDSDWSQFEHFFVEGMRRSIDRIGATTRVFDTHTNTQAAAPHLPCPTMDADFFRRICRFAFESNFGRRCGSARRSACSTYAGGCRLGRPSQSASDTKKERRPSYVGLRVTGAGGGRGNGPSRGAGWSPLMRGSADRCTATFHLNSQTFAALATESTTALAAVESGRIDIKGNGLPLATLTGCGTRLPQACPTPVDASMQRVTHVARSV